MQLDLVNDDAASSAVPAPPVDAADDEDEVKSTDGEDDEDTADEAGSSKPRPAAAASTSDSLRQVYTAEAEAYAKESNLLFYEASAKTGQNVGDLFTEIGGFAPHSTFHLR